MSEDYFDEVEVLETSDPDFRPWNMEMKTYLMLMHLSPLAGGIVPFAGIVMPILMYVTNKDKSKEVAENGKEVLNWMISAFIYIFTSLILTIVFPPFIFMVFIIFLLDLIFIIIGAVKAYNGELYKYPLSIRLIK